MPNRPSASAFASWSRYLPSTAMSNARKPLAPLRQAVGHVLHAAAVELAEDDDAVLAAAQVAQQVAHGVGHRPPEVGRAPLGVDLLPPRPFEPAMNSKESSPRADPDQPEPARSCRGASR